MTPASGAFVLMIAVTSSAQASEAPPCAVEELEQIAFVEGEWEITSRQGTADGEVAEVAGKAVIRRTLSGCLYEESLQTRHEGRTHGEKRIYAYDRRNRKWDYVSVDTEHGNAAGMEGAFEQDRLVLHHVTPRRGHVLLDRVIVARSEESGFFWLLETSADAGSSWTFVWRIDYRRKP